ncbi:MAG TPA: penicillin-binding protein 2 [Treponema sp.]|nr:MAG: penicillin-binding protein 2 [Treponema sp. GWA1_62_8]OHE65062.1 MAG: penicillin-binding protein 2 [Treponema sp. GWC1_61_84]OHE72450.1 MAG: penicillin-binding protein 2 [Treponema sp. RIFOXYC1_FULL_61_9]HCM26047.1 penicillin-binding protein 2 [Treponema sp.]
MLDYRKRVGEERPVFRINALQYGYLAIFIIYGIKLFSMQIMSGDFYKDKAKNIARRMTVTPAQRGEIFDRNYNLPMVLNIDSFAVNIIPAEIPDEKKGEVFASLSELLNIGIQQIERKVPKSSYHLYQAIEVVSSVPIDTIARISERIDELPGVAWKSKPVRNYVETGSFSHIIGYVGDITKEELKVMYNRGYASGDVIGKTGIERQYDDILRGKDGNEIKVVDVRGRSISGDEQTIETSPVMGKNLVLTIDRSIQLLAEKALGERMGAVVVTRPSTGEVLAMVSYPYYDPNVFNSTSGGSAYQTLLEDPNKPFLNRAIQSHYPPASTFKVVMTTGILAEKSFPPEKTIDCDGELLYGDRIFRCHIRRPGHGPLNLQEALGESCDVYFWTTGRDFLGVERIVSYAKDFGFGQATGIDLPGEIAGFVPTPQWKERKFHEKWLGGDTMNMSIGQGYTLVTPLQMADMVAMVVNDGVIYQPHILKEIRDPVSGAIIKSAKPVVLHKSDIDSALFETVRENMRYVVKEGTAEFPVNIKSVEIAGKTGTGEVGLADRWHSWFTAFAPYETDVPEERVVVSIIVEASNQWEWWAPYASAIIFQGIFAQQSYEDAVKTLGFQYLMPARERRE